MNGEHVGGTWRLDSLGLAALATGIRGVGTSPGLQSGDQALKGMDAQARLWVPLAKV